MYEFGALQLQRGDLVNGPGPVHLGEGPHLFLHSFIHSCFKCIVGYASHKLGWTPAPLLFSSAEGGRSHGAQLAGEFHPAHLVMSVQTVYLRIQLSILQVGWVRTPSEQLIARYPNCSGFLGAAEAAAAAAAAATTHERKHPPHLAAKVLVIR